MARNWRRAILATLAGTMLACACSVASHAQPGAEPEAEEGEGAHSKAGARKRQDPVEAQHTVDAALQQVQAGRTEQAIQSLSATLSGGNLPPAIMAKALLVRGMAYRQHGQPAQAISDLTSALWLKGGLDGDDRAEAARERAAAYAAAGLQDPGDDVPAEPTPNSASSGNWLSNLLGGGNMFGSSSASSPPPSPRPRPKAAPPVDASEPASAPQTAAAISDAWSTDGPPSAPSHTQKQPSAPPQPSKSYAHSAKAPRPPARAEAPSKPAEGHFLIQLAAVRTEAEARALAAKAKRAHAAMLAGRGQSVDRAVFGNMGAYYRARFGPFASAQETQAACAKLQGSGIDCLPVTR